MAESDLMTRADVAEVLGIKVHYFDFWVRNEKAPQPYRIVGVGPRWKRTEINKYKEDMEYIGAIPLRNAEIDINDPEIGDEVRVDRTECAKYLKVSTQTWDKMVRNGNAPRPLRLAGATYNFRPRWRAGDVRALAK